MLTTKGQDHQVVMLSAGTVKLKGVGSRRSVHGVFSSPLRRKSNLDLLSTTRSFGLATPVLDNLREVLLGTKISLLFAVIPAAFVSYFYHFGKVWIFAFSLIALMPLAERVSFLTEQISFYTGPTVGGFLNATCGNATELIISLLALSKGKMKVVKSSLLGSVLSNLLLVLGTSLFLGGIKNAGKQQKFDQTQAGASCSILLMATLCQLLAFVLNYYAKSGLVPQRSPLHLSRVGSILMLVAYTAYLVFQLKTQTQCLENKEDDDDQLETQKEEVMEEEVPSIGLWSAIVWLVGMTTIISILSEFVVGTIEDASESWGLSVSFISIVLLPIVGNAAEHAGSIIFAMKNKLDISLGVAMGSATQISLFVVPFTVIVSWILGIGMDLDFKMLETVSLFSTVLITTIVLQDGASHYMKGLVLLLLYCIIATTFFLLHPPMLIREGKSPAMHAPQ